MSVRNTFPQQRPTLNLDFANSKTLDPRITFTRTSTATYVDEDGLIKSVDADVARFDHDPETGECLGLLVEESRTNDIRNNTMQGAIAGTPGTAPTNWVLGTSAAGFTREITDVGVENGIQYVDIRWYGTATGNPFSYLAFWPDGSNTINSPGTYTSRYTFSSYVKVVSGTVPSSTTFILVMTNADSGSIGLNEYKISTIVSSSSVPTGNLIDNRFALTNTDFSNTNTAYFKPYFQWNIPNGTSMDVTIRIGLPQMEEGSFATSAIPTTDQGKTRNPDNAYIEGSKFTEFYNSTEGSAVCYFSSPTEYGRTNACPFVFSINRNTIGWGHYVGSSGASVSLFRNPSNSNEAFLNTGSAAGTTDQNRKLSVGYKLNDFAQYLNIGGGNVSQAIDTLGEVRTDINAFAFNPQHSGLRYFGGHIQKFLYYPTKFTNTQLRNLAL